MTTPNKPWFGLHLPNCTFAGAGPAEIFPRVVAGPEEAAEGLRPYLDAGFTGFTFNNNLYRTPDDIAAVGEVLRLVGG